MLQGLIELNHPPSVVIMQYIVYASIRYLDMIFPKVQISVFPDMMICTNTSQIYMYSVSLSV